MTDWIGYKWLAVTYGIELVQRLRTESLVAKSRTTESVDVAFMRKLLRKPEMLYQAPVSLALSGAFFLAENTLSEMPGSPDNDILQQARPVSYDLADLVSRITPQNRPPELKTKPVGRERI